MFVLLSQVKALVSRMSIGYLSTKQATWVRFPAAPLAGLAWMLV
jgi:hypothetical protein